MTDMYWIVIGSGFFFIAFVYSLVGFGGGSSYLALLAVSGMDYSQIAPTALVCNLIVATSGHIYFNKAGFFKLNKALPFILTSIPMAYAGGMIHVSERLFFLLLGLSLLAASIRMFIPERFSENTKIISERKWWMMGLPIGALLGMLSGLVGIGGGIFLSPLLILLRWVQVKEAAAIASFFIVVNSVAGFLGQMNKGFFLNSHVFFLGFCVLLGGQIGSRIGSFHAPQKTLLKTLAALILMVSIKLLWGLK